MIVQKKYSTFENIEKLDPQLLSSQPQQNKKPYSMIAQSIKLTGHSVLSYNQSQLYTTKFAPTINILASAGKDRLIFIWDPYHSQPNRAVLKGHKNAILQVTFSSTSDFLYSCSADKTVIIWDLNLVKKLRGHQNVINAIGSTFKGGERVVTVGDDNFGLMWDTRKKTSCMKIPLKHSSTCVSFNLNGDKLFIGGINNKIICYNTKSQKIQYVLQGHQDSISGLSLSFDGSYVCSNSFDQTIRIWDTRAMPFTENRMLKVLVGHRHSCEKNLLRSCWSRDGIYVSGGSSDGLVYIWDTTTRKLRQQLSGHSGPVSECSFTKELMSSCSLDKTVIVTQLPQIFI